MKSKTAPKSQWLALSFAVSVAAFACGYLPAQETPRKPTEPAKAPAQEFSTKLTDQQQKAVDFAKRYFSARTPKSKHDAWRGVRAVQLRVVFLDSDARANLSKPAVESAVAERLAAAGLKVVEREDAPYLVLSVNTVDCGSVLAYDVRLELLEEVVLLRPGQCLKTVVKPWQSAQFGSTLKTDAGDHLATAVLAGLKELTAGLAESK